MSFPYDASDSASGFPHWETLQHSPLDTPVPTPSSATFGLEMDPMDLNLDDQQQQQQHDQPTPPTIDNTPILLHRPGEHAQVQQRHRPIRAPSTPSMHPIDAMIFSRPGSASSTTTPHPIGQVIGRTTHQQPFAPSPGPAGYTTIMNINTTNTPVPTPTAAPSKQTGGRGPVRTTTAGTRTRGATASSSSHPYLRPTPTRAQAQAQKGGGGGGQSSSSSASPFMHNVGMPTTIMTRSKARKQSVVKFADPPHPPPGPTASAVFAPTPTPTEVGPMTHHHHTTAHGGMLERPATTTTTRPSSAMTHHFFESTVMTGSSQQHDTAAASSTSPVPMETASGNISQRPSPPQTAPQASTSTQPSKTTTTTRTRPKIPPHRLTTLPVQTDMSYSPQTHTLSCSLELPGVLPSHLRVSLGTCYFNHVKYVGVVGESVPVFGKESVLLGGGGERSLEEVREEEARRGLRAELVGGIRSGLRRDEGEGDDDQETDEHIKIGRIVNPNLRERKFGIFRRFIQVPSYTTPKDIAATLKHGVLTLHIYCGAPFDQDDEEEVPIALE